MRILCALSIATALSLSNAALACPNGIHETEVKILASLQEPVLLNRDSEAPIDSLPFVEEPLLLNSYDFDSLPSPIVSADLDLQHLRVVVDDEGIPLMDIGYTGSIDTAVVFMLPSEDQLALDGYEDR